MFKAHKTLRANWLQKLLLCDEDVYPNRGVQKLKKMRYKSNEIDAQFDVVFNTVF